MDYGAISGVSVTDNVALITAGNLANDSYLIHRIFSAVAKERIHIDMISLSQPYKNNISLSFTVDETDVLSVIETIGKFKTLTCDVNSGNSKVTVCGSGRISSATLASEVLDLLFDCGADIKLITASDETISMLIGDSHTDIVQKMLEGRVQGKSDV